MTQYPLVADFHEPIKIGTEFTLPVYISQNGEIPLIVLHELPGMSDSFISFCRNMAGKGFKVYMPLMFKSPGTSMNRGQSFAFCLSREFRNLFSTKTASCERPFASWLLDLVQHVSDRHPDAKIGIVGMCLTGGFAIAGIASPQVHAVAACQPSFPFAFKIKTLGLSESEREDVKAGLAGKTFPCVKAYRYQRDKFCRESHMKAAKELVGDAMERFSPDLPGKGHSTLTTDTASPQVYDDVLEFLKRRL